MWLRVAAILGILIAIDAFQNCPNGCDCLPDPLVESSFLYVCRWSSLPSDFNFSNSSSIRSLQIVCEDGFSLPNSLFRTLGGLQHLRIEACRWGGELPEELFEPLKNLRSLHLHEVSLAHETLGVSDDALANLKRLEKLSITSSNLVHVPEKLFCSLKNLQVLNVSSNWISTLSSSAPHCIANQLIIVDFSHNRLDRLGTELNTLPAVRQLSLSNNRLSSIEQGSLLKCPLLQQLELNNNLLEGIENLPETLIHINLASNQLSTIPPSLVVLPHLVSLNLSHNSIDESSPNVFTSNVLELLDLSWNRISTIPSRLYPNSMGSLVHLHLEGNHIPELKPLELMNYTRLQTLNIASNRLEKLRDDIFAGLNELSALRLANNSIDTVEPAAFADLTLGNLFEGDVDLSHNRLTEVPIAIGRLFRLKKIDLSHNKIKKLHQFIFNKISHLHTIDLSHNELPSVSPYVFSDCAYLTSLNLSHNHISQLFHDSLAKCPLLKRIDLSDNRLGSLADALSQALAVRRLDVSRNRLELLQWDELPPRLEHLIVDSNIISLLGAAIKSKVRTASLRGNRIEQLSADQIPDTLEILDLSANRVQHIAAATFAAKTSLRSLDLSDNRLPHLAEESLLADGVHSIDANLRGNPLRCSCELHWIKKQEIVKRKVNVVDMSETLCTHPVTGKVLPLDKVDSKDLLCEYSQVCEPDCVCCQFGNCDCKAVCPTGCACFRDALFETNVVRCEHLTEADMKGFSPSAVPISATHVHLSGLSIPILRSHSFLGRPRLEHLFINGSGIRGIQPKAFNTLPKLKLLDLSDNAIVRLSGDEFHKTSAISHLFLNGNRLRTVERGLTEKLPSLTTLSLHNNDLTDVSSALMSSGVRSLSLSGNAFRCDCTPRFSAPMWIHENRAKVVDMDRVRCVENVTESFRNNDTTVLSAYPPNVGHDVFTMSMDEFLRDFNRTICVPASSGFFGQEPQNSILTVIFLTSCAFLLCAMTLLGVSLVRKAHNDMSQRRYKASSSLNCSSTPGSSPLPVPLLNFDAFVSYSKKDEKMVLEQLCRPLEDEEYALCLLHRDGPAYHSRLHAISDELISQMEASQCLVIVLTKNFLESEWKTLQIKTSHQLFAKNRSKRVIAVLGEGVDQNLLDEELGQILRKNTCIRQRDHLFWQLLRSALPTRLASVPGSGDDASQIYSDMYGIVPSAVL
ncbi:leucine Rich repeat-containing domain protein [Necator americanus]|uniref:Leucine Rich repeat-containing domain protein n=1 Tax=Necator americanus TaxID=51031 RepID=W2SQL7_NECAM|nr:leucine Rich repeat-containing domain protein [Necator americanus]ETN70992.1 leucine Rich repeat-containing domain protein [Necator americanus]